MSKIEPVPVEIPTNEEYIEFKLADDQGNVSVYQIPKQDIEPITITPLVLDNPQIFKS